LVGYGKNRTEAIARLGAALDACYIRGVSHNVAFLAATLQKKRFIDGRLSTNFIAEEFPHGFTGVEITPEALDQAIVVAAAVQRITAEREARISGQLAGHGRVVPEVWTVCIGEERHDVRTVRSDEGITVTRAEGREHRVASAWQSGQPLFRGTVDETAVVFQVDRDGTGFRLTRGGATLAVKVLPPRAAELLTTMPAKQAPDLSRFLLSPMPGLLVSVAVGEGQEVKAGEELAVVEAMKMENVLRAERDGKVSKVRAKAGDSLAVDQVIIEFG
jgi:propionyl-CoA carboxylase alpha chain